MTDGTQASDGSHELIDGRYRLDDRIGSGAMGVVWRAFDLRLDRTVAVKQLLLPPGLNDADTEKARQRAFREGRIAARLQHSNAISVYSVADHDGRPVLVMEYLPSRSLAAILDERGTLPAVEAARIGAQVAAALTAAHAAGVVHRDVKPGNILLGEDGTAKITDFGISRASGDLTLTSTGLFAGTPAFLAPETAQGAAPDAAADVFSLGACLYTAVEGRPPFDNPGNEIAMLHAVASGHIVPPRQAGVLTTPLRAMLRVEPGTRPTMALAEQQLGLVAEGRIPPADAFGPAPGPPARGATRVEQLPGAGVTPPAPSAARQQPARAPQPRPSAAGPAPVVRAGASAGSPAGRSRTRSGVIAVVAVGTAVIIGILVAELLVAPGDDEESGGSGAGEPSPTAVVRGPVPEKPMGPGTGSGPPGSTPVASGPEGSAPTGSVPDSPPTSSTQEDGPVDPVVAVREYYSLLPEDTDAAWARLGPSLKAESKRTYEKFWSSITALEIVSGPESVGDDLVEIELDYHTKNKGVTRQVHRLRTVVQDERTLINEEELVSSGDRPD